MVLTCVVLRRFLYVEAPAEDASLVFAVAFVIVWAGAFVITVNCYLLGGNAYVSRCYSIIINMTTPRCVMSKLDPVNAPQISNLRNFQLFCFH